MLPKLHFIAGIFFIFLIYLLFPQISLIGLLIIFLSSVFIDVDHYVYYILKERNLNLVKCYNWYILHLKKTLFLPMKERKNRYTGFYFFHGIEWIILLFLLGAYVHPFFSFVFVGFLFHWVIDTPHEFYIKRTLDKSSLIWNYYRWRKLSLKY